MTALRQLCTVLALGSALLLAGCETNDVAGNDTGSDAANDATTTDVSGDDGADVTVPPDGFGSDPGTSDLPPLDVTEAADGADTADVPHPTGCCETADACAEGSVCLGLDFGAPGTCWPAPTDGGCFFDTDCGVDERCLGEHQTNCMMSSLPWEGTCVKGPSDCCESDLDCTAFGDYVCAATGSNQTPGICMPRPADGRCWTDLQCEPYEHCKDARACGCLVDCDAWIEAGHCEPDQPTECCHTNDECPEGYCVAGNLGAGGVCHTELLPDGSCFTDADCGGEELVCKGEQLCSCDMNCISVAGTCLPSWNDCCFTDAQCTGDAICAGEGPGGYAGVCKLPAAFDGKCWDDGECGFGSECVGAAICPCDADCDMVDAPGTCQGVLGCCQSDEDCLLPVDQEFVCAGVDPTSGLGVCLPAITSEGPCWDDLDCAVGKVCSGATFCACGTLCGQIQAPGTCVDLPVDDCCGSDADCGQGQQCVFLPDVFADEIPGACKPILTDGMCWVDDDCKPEDLCLGATPCPCGHTYGDGCDIPGTCTPKDQYGCCTSDADCGVDQFCLALTKTCVAKPNPGHCYTSADCNGAACVGATFCPCGMLCAIGTFPGACQELPAGCCTGDLDCAEGMVCRGDGGAGGLPGSCVPDPLGPACLGDVACCWNDGDCPASSTCHGASVCGCIELCPMCGACMPDQMGYCGN